MRVATFNINNINKRLANVLGWLAKAEPDVVSLQELKEEQAAFPVNAVRDLGYEAVWQGERSWNGVAILARNHTPELTCRSLTGKAACSAFSSCRLTTSGSALANQANKLASRLLMLLMLKVATLTKLLLPYA